jgi:hypothetical protein
VTEERRAHLQDTRRRFDAARAKVGAVQGAREELLLEARAALGAFVRLGAHQVPVDVYLAEVGDEALRALVAEQRVLRLLEDEP